MVPTFRQSVSVVILFVLMLYLASGLEMFNANTSVVANSQSHNQTQNVTPVITDIVSTTDIVAGQPAGFVVVVENPVDGLTYTWLFGDNTPAVVTTDSTRAHTYNSPGRVTIEVIVDGVGQFSKSFVVTSPPTPTPAIPKPPSNVVLRPSIDGANKIYEVLPSANFGVIAVVGDGTPPYNYQWFLDSVPIVTSTDSASIDLSLSETRSYFVQVVVSNGSGQTATDSIRVDVQPETVAGLKVLPPLTIVEGEEIPFQASITSGKDVQFFFDYGNGQTSAGFSVPIKSKIYNAPSPLPTYEWKAGNEGNEYTVIVQAKAGNQPIVEDSQCIIIQPAPIKNLRISTVGHSQLPTKAIDFSAFTNGGRVISYEWSGRRIITDNPSGQSGQKGPDVLSQTQDKISHAFREPGIYLIKVQANGPEFITKCGGTIKQPNQRIAYTLASSGIAQAATNVILKANDKPVATSDDFQFSVEYQKIITYTVEGLGDPNEVSTVYKWDFGDGSDPKSGGSTMAHGYQNTTTEPYVLQITPQDGDTSRAFYAIISVTGLTTYLPFAMHSIDTIQQASIISEPVATNTPVRPTNTPISPTSTPVPPTATPIPPTATDVPTAVPTDTPTMIPTNTAEATATLSPTPVPPTATPELPTAITTDTPTVTFTNTPTPTNEPTLTSTSSPEITSISTITPIPTSSLLKPTPIPTSTRAP